MKDLLSNVKISSAITPTAGVAGTTTINGTTLDMAGFDAVTALVRLGAITATAVTSIKWQQGDAANLSDAADLAGTGMTILDTDDDSIVVSQLVRPTKRYVRLVVLRGTANAVVASAEYIQHEPKEVPQTQPAGTASETNVAPAQGTP